jgi:hypothetical protein
MAEHEYFMIEVRSRTLIPKPGSQRRCYNGCYPDSDWEHGWGRWEWLTLKLTKEKAALKLRFLEDLSTYAVRKRGPEAESQYRIVPDTVYDGTW